MASAAGGSLPPSRRGRKRPFDASSRAVSTLVAAARGRAGSGRARRWRDRASRPSRRARSRARCRRTTVQEASTIGSCPAEVAPRFSTSSKAASSAAWARSLLASSSVEQRLELRPTLLQLGLQIDIRHLDCCAAAHELPHRYALQLGLRGDTVFLVGGHQDDDACGGGRHVRLPNVHMLMIRSCRTPDQVCGRPRAPARCRHGTCRHARDPEEHHRQQHRAEQLEPALDAQAPGHRNTCHRLSVHCGLPTSHATARARLLPVDQLHRLAGVPHLL